MVNIYAVKIIFIRLAVNPGIITHTRRFTDLVKDLFMIFVCYDAFRSNYTTVYLKNSF